MNIFSILFAVTMLVAMAAGMIISSYMNRQREGALKDTEDARTAEPLDRTSMFWSGLIALSFTGFGQMMVVGLFSAFMEAITSATVMVLSPGQTYLMVFWMLVNFVWLAMYILYPHRKWFPPAAMFWGGLASWGGVWIYVGLSAAAISVNTFSNIGGIIAAILFILATGVWVTATVVMAVKLSVDLSKEHKVFIKLTEPGAILFIQNGTKVNRCFGDTTGVPLAKKAPPLELVQRGPGAAWEWMMTDLERRADPRIFMSNDLWVGPTFIYPGIPFFTICVGLREPLVAELGEEMGKAVSLRLIPDYDFKKGPFAAGGSRLGTSQDDPELEPTVGFGWRVVNPLVLWHTVSVADVFDHEMDVLIAGLVEACGMDLYGYHGSLNRLAQLYRDIAQQADTDGKRELEIKSLATAGMVDGLLTHLVQHVAEQTGILVSSVMVKDVDVSSTVLEIFNQRINAKALKAMAKDLAATHKAVQGAYIEAILEVCVANKITDQAELASIVKQAVLLKDDNPATAALAVLYRGQIDLPVRS